MERFGRLLVKFSFCCFCLILISCSHTIEFPTSRFAVPYVATDSLKGNVNVHISDPASITVATNLDGNPPTHGPVSINTDGVDDITDLISADGIGIGVELAIAGPLEIFYDTKMAGLRWQVLGHGGGAGTWVASIQGGLTGFEETTSQSDYSASSKVKSTQKGISVGRQGERVLGYVSYLEETHSVETNISNSNGSFGPYDDSGKHKIYSVGMSTYSSHFLIGIEYSYANIEWDTNISDVHEAVGLRVGFAW
ncbi:MAG: hypothetical protein VX642_06525 [Bdellovibrionota bacterium]|nr:hypothetical protein [Bdellovibrionota bacterium]